jgi:hypothetical protein
MSCNTNRNVPITTAFAAVANPNCGQFFNPGNFSGEQVIYDTAFKDLINNFGIPVDYYINTFNLSAADNLYGEHPTAVFYGPVSIMMYVELNENAISLSKFGFASDDELTGYVHIQTFTDIMSGKYFYIRTDNGDFLNYNESPSDFDRLLGNDREAYFKYFNNGQAIEPKSGDLIQISPLGCDRPNGRGAKIFEITERTDQDISSLNPLLGHYIYRLRAKRYEYSFEPGAPQEPQNQQVFENSFSGKLSSNIFNDNTAVRQYEQPSEDKSYPGDVDTESKTKVLDMSVNDTDIYGSYY